MAIPQQQVPATLGRAATITVIGLLAVFIGSLIVLGLMRDDKNWDRLIYLLAGLEAVVFAGAGALFGTTVQRAQVVEAKQELVAERQRADANEGDATAGRALHQGVIAKEAEAAAATRTGQPEIRAGRPTGPAPGSSSGASSDVADLARLARSLFPDR
ncbi:hypothetical protein [Kitasatospora cinereorecta]|uniref:Integral membrane protein n=1 Tax=Kitasatospora cinereorecta TaxID=285560 RepID=A0ABW0VH69_9ACTN